MTTRTKHSDWAAKMSEANDAIGAARDALASARTQKARREAAEDLDWWIGRKAFVEAAGRTQHEPEPVKDCPTCEVAMSVETIGSTTYNACRECGLFIPIAL